MTKNFVPFSEAVPQIKDADLLLWRPHGGLIAHVRGWIVARLTRGEHCHASKAAWLGGVLQTIGTEEGRGGVEEPLEPLVGRYPGKIDVYKTNPCGKYPTYESLPLCPWYDRAAAIAWIRQAIKEGGVARDYGWQATLRCALSRFVILRWLPWFRPNRNDDANGRPPNCSALCSMGDDLGGGVDPVPGLANNATEPVNLANSMFHRYRFTLVPDTGQGVKP